ncbi:hypothetical protein MAPG_04508 [Magnaporthiopsis poae ATCC 64411]|uniref:Uncharacterized protein n=1 Tax=Magnaporthiopsis poae (strain ATCC 64411 / 73-15) TaxID=644358 RepID=A0A0C4DWX4_MAGP6|nr:hypothetical protein MAPG_04508 [Magnaporthiopsis poae ATCC 64411]
MLFSLFSLGTASSARQKNDLAPPRSPNFTAKRWIVAGRKQTCNCQSTIFAPKQANVKRKTSCPIRFKSSSFLCRFYQGMNSCTWIIASAMPTIFLSLGIFLENVSAYPCQLPLLNLFPIVPAPRTQFGLWRLPRLFTLLRLVPPSQTRPPTLGRRYRKRGQTVCHLGVAPSPLLRPRNKRMAETSDTGPRAECGQHAVGHGWDQAPAAVILKGRLI